MLAILNMQMCCQSGEASPGASAAGLAEYHRCMYMQALEGETEDSLKRRRQSANSAHNRLRVARSDVLSALTAFCAYINAPDRERFCR